MRGLRLIAALDEPDDFVLATGESHSVADWCEAAFSVAGLNWRDHVRAQDPALMRPAEVDYLQGDASKAREVLGWKPEVLFRDLTRLMVEHDTAAAP